MTASATSASCQFSTNSTVTAITRRITRDRRRDDRHLQQARRRVDVAREPRQDAARLHVPERRQRQAQQALEQRAAQRQHHARVDEALPIVARHVQRRRQRDDGRNAPPARFRRRRRSGVAAAVSSSTRSVMKRMNSGSIISSPAVSDREHEDDGDGPPLRPEPAQVVLQVVAALGAALGRGRLLVGAGDLVVERSFAVVAAEGVVMLARGAGAIHGRDDNGKSLRGGILHHAGARFRGNIRVRV